MSPNPLQQEPDTIPLRAIVAAIGFTVFVTVACIVYVAILLPARVGDVALIPSAAPAVDQTLYDRGPGFSAPITASKRDWLAGYGWVDRDHKTVRIPIERAMKLVVDGRVP